ncbi:1,4-dihydroxy-2-naphthoate polyprenyltransferase [Ignavibacteria bacterium]|nr:1,4-dihydroxy-2-naphthoate polyprenyltransferase [Bacteroidota bacterium]MCZ2132911.1 1,4-dihydroxy-2-naphthoate polyprenyltransferase [Bacteroidota bacterium]
MTNISIWFEALRPKTLPASIVPVALGSAIAAIDGKFTWSIFIATLLCAALMQIASNFINEIYDFRRGADTPLRLGPRRAVSEGVISEQNMKFAALIAITVAFLIGLYLTSIAGWPIFVVGVISLAAAWAYTGGKYPLAYIGLGEAMAFIFYGIIAVCGVYYIYTGTVTQSAVMLSLAPAALSANILAVNNIRDIETDRIAGKRTFAVRFGVIYARVMYAIFTVIPFITTIALVSAGYSKYIMLSFVAIPAAVMLIIGVVRRKGADLNPILAGTGALLAVYAVLLIIGLFV